MIHVAIRGRRTRHARSTLVVCQPPSERFHAVGVASVVLHRDWKRPPSPDTLGTCTHPGFASMAVHHTSVDGDHAVVVIELATTDQMEVDELKLRFVHRAWHVLRSRGTHGMNVCGFEPRPGSK